MTRTAPQVWFGNGQAFDLLGANARLNPQCREVWVENSIDAAGLKLLLPDARWLRPGGAWFRIHNATSDVLLVKCQDGTTNVPTHRGSGGSQSIDTSTTFDVGEECIVFLRDNSTANGQWLCDVRPSAVCAVGGTFSSAAQYFDITLRDDSIATYDVAARLPALGWDGTSIVYPRIWVPPGTNLGGSPAIRSGTLPSSSRILLVVSASATVLGAGGNAGRGGDVPPGLLSQAGSNGADAVQTSCNMTLANSGIISGGGGGGGGGAYSGSFGGGGGGGGAGQPGGLGGAGGRGGGFSGAGGSSVNPGAGGAPGGGSAVAGASGGGLGTSGSSSSSAGGTGGRAIRTSGGASVTTLRAGTLGGGIGT